MRRIIINLFVTVLLFLSFMVYGLYEKKNHKDLNRDKDLIDSFYVALLKDETVSEKITSEDGKNLLDKSSYILEVECKSAMKFHFSEADQLVEVKKVFRGTDIQVGDKIQILKVNEVFLDLPPSPFLNISCVREMNIGEHYLVFLKEKIENYEDTKLFETTDFYMQPIFSYEQTEQGYCTPSVPNTIDALYGEVKDKEFFLMSEQAVEEMEAFKKELFLKYPQ